MNKNKNNKMDLRSEIRGKKEKKKLKKWLGLKKIMIDHADEEKKNK